VCLCLCVSVSVSVSVSVCLLGVVCVWERGPRCGNQERGKPTLQCVLCDVCCVLWMKGRAYEKRDEMHV
jgi:hypothetical protein